MRTLVISDLHLGNRGRRDVLRLAPVRARLLEAIDDADRLVLLGDTVELMTRRPDRSMAIAEPVLRAIGRQVGSGREVILLPGNHDAPLVHRWALTQGARLTVDSPVPADASPALERLVSWLAPAPVRVRYPGVWLDPGVWATHGHYLDRHLIPQSAVGLHRGRLRDPPHRPIDYDNARRLHRQRRRRRRRGRDRPEQPLARRLAWSAANLVRAAATPAAVGLPQLLLHGGLSQVTARAVDTQMRHATIPAMADVARCLGVEADWLLFGHVHRRGPIGDEHWPAAGDTRLLNTGSWLYEPLLVDRARPPHGYWPGGAVVLEAGRSPRSVGLLDELDADALRPRGPVSDAGGAGSAASAE